MSRKSKRKKLHQPYFKFMAYLRENNIKLRDLSEVLDGVSIQTISMKNNGWSEYTMSEIDKICSHYGISSEIFRAQKVS